MFQAALLICSLSGDICTTYQDQSNTRYKTYADCQAYIAKVIKSEHFEEEIKRHMPLGEPESVVGVCKEAT